MAAQNQSPATKEDICLLMEQMGKYYDQTDKNIGELRQDMTAWKKEIIHEFYVVAENIRHDLLKGALHDKIEQHEDRIIRLEQHVGLAA